MSMFRWIPLLSNWGEAGSLSDRAARPRRSDRLASAIPAMVQVLEARQLLSVNAVNDSYTVANNSATPTAVSLEVTQNDFATPAGQIINITSATGAAHGTLQVVDMPALDYILYTPQAGYSGPDSFFYTISAGPDTATGSVSLTITSNGSPSNQPPTFNQANYAFTLANTAQPGSLGTVAATDPTPGHTAMLAYSILNNPNPAAFSINATTGQINYNGGWPAGQTSISFQVQAAAR